MSDALSVLIVDDSTIYRKLLVDVAGRMPNTVVVGTAPTGPIALRKIPVLAPQLVLLDIEMPEMSGVETLEHIKRDYPDVEVVLVSGTTSRNADIVMDGLAKGAVDFIPKPSGTDYAENERELRRDLSHSFLAVRTRLVRSGGGGGAKRPAMAPAPTRPAPTVRAGLPPRPIKMVAIGISTGGPQALSEMVPALPGTLKVPVLIVQHMPPLFTASLADSLNKVSPLTVVEAQNGQSIEPGTVYIAPGGIHMGVRASSRQNGHYEVALVDSEPVNSCKPAVDVLFASLAETVGNGLLSVIMTGMGQDGMNGVAEIKKKGGWCLTQTEDSCVIYGMPQAVDQAQLSDEQIPLDQLAKRITELVG